MQQSNSHDAPQPPQEHGSGPQNEEPAEPSPEQLELNRAIYRELTLLAHHEDAHDMRAGKAGVVIAQEVKLAMDREGEFRMRLDNERSGRRFVATLSFTEASGEFVGYNVTPQALRIERLEMSTREGVLEATSIGLSETRDVLEHLRSLTVRESARGKL